MSIVSKPAAGTSSVRCAAVARLISAAANALILAALWWVLTGGSTHSWLFGAPLVLICAIAGQLFSSSSHVHYSLVGIFQFVPFFIWASLRGGINAAVLVASRTLDVRPLTVEYVTTLPPGPPTAVFAGTIGLMPGTLAVEIVRNRLEVHVLDESIPVLSELQALERRLAAVFVGGGQKQT